MPKKKVKEDFIVDAIGAHSDGHVALMEPEDEVKDKPVDVMKGKNKVKINPSIGENVESVKKKNEKDPNGDAKKGEEDWRSMKTKRSLTLNKLRACGLKMGYEPKGEQLSDEVTLPKINKTVKMVQGIRKGVLPLDQTKLKKEEVEGTLPKKSEVHEQHGEEVDGKFMSYATMKAKGIKPKKTALQSVRDKYKDQLYDPNKKETEEERKKREERQRKEREKREKEKAEAFAARAKKAGYNNPQDYANVVAQYGSEKNMKQGKGLGS